jgi:hypothetical protein
MSRRPEGYLEEHLPYELGMLDHSFSRLHTITYEPDFNSFLESFCQHARNLKAFVTGDKGKGNNSVIASDFVQGFVRKMPSSLTGAFQRINEQTNHLAKKRPINPAKKFTVTDAKAIVAWLRPVMHEFVASLEAEDAKVWNAAARRTKIQTVAVNAQSPQATNAIQQLTHTTSAAFYGPIVFEAGKTR